MSNGALRHGEAVSIGIALDLFCAETLKLIAFEEIDSILKAMQTATLPIWSNLLNQREELIEGLREFQEHIGGDLTLTMPQGLGKLIEINKLPTDIINQAINKLKKYWEKQTAHISGS
jgi:3-dehydroquinate synthase